MPATIDVDVWRGNSLPPIEWAWPEGYAATVNCQLSVWVGGELLFSAQDGGGLVIDTGGRRFLWDRTLEQSRAIPLGRLARYEIEDRNGGETTIFCGVMVGLGGLNLDTDAPAATGQLDFTNPYNSGHELDGWI